MGCAARVDRGRRLTPEISGYCAERLRVVSKRRGIAILKCILLSKWSEKIRARYLVSTVYSVYFWFEFRRKRKLISIIRKQQDVASCSFHQSHLRLEIYKTKLVSLKSGRVTKLVKLHESRSFLGFSPKIFVPQTASKNSHRLSRT